MINQHWFRWWLNTIRHQAITCAKVYLHIWCHIYDISRQKAIKNLHIFSPDKCLHNGAAASHYKLDCLPSPVVLKAVSLQHQSWCLNSHIEQLLAWVQNITSDDKTATLKTFFLNLQKWICIIQNVCWKVHSTIYWCNALFDIQFFIITNGSSCYLCKSLSLFLYPLS